MSTAGRAALAAMALLLARADRTVAEPVADPAACVRTLAALDGEGRVLFQTVALVLDRDGLAAAPLDPLERGGVRWERLELRGADGMAAAAVDGAWPRADLNLALLRVAGSAACPAATLEPAGSSLPPPGAPVRCLRGRRGYRPGTIGGRVERVVALPDAPSVALVHLLDDGGADPGLVLDAGGRLLGASIPTPPESRASMATVALAAGALSLDGADRWSEARSALPSRPAPSSWSTVPGLVGQALLAQGRERSERGIALLGEALARGGDAPSLHIERGVLEFGVARMPAAIEDFRRATEMDPLSHLALYNLGVALGAVGRYRDAIDALRQARDLKPDHARTRYQLALALGASRQAGEARRECAALRSLDPDLAEDLEVTLGF